eukprot:2853856-Prymnesium_polylepis.1
MRTSPWETRLTFAQRLDLSLDATHVSFPLNFASPHSNHGGGHVCQSTAITIGGLVNAEGGSVGRVN